MQYGRLGAFFWLMMVSMAMAVLPVWRSPMISSRWPRPIGIMASMALMPVCRGSTTGARPTTPGATTSMGRVLVGLDGALAVDGAAQGVHHAADQGLADGNLHDLAGAADPVALVDEVVLAQKNARRRSPSPGSKPCP